MEIPTNFYKDHLEDLPSDPRNFCDWYHEVTFEHEGKEYLVVFSVVTSSDTTSTHIQLLEGPLVLVETINERNHALFNGAHPLSKFNVIQPANIEFHSLPSGPKAGNFVQTDLGEKGFRVANKQMEVEYTKFNGPRFVKVDAERISAKLTFTPRGPALWWGNEPYKRAPLYPEFDVIGTEELCYVDGTIVFDGKELKVVKGKGISEHVWIERLDWMVWRYMNWTWFHTDQLYGLLYGSVMKGNYRYDWGSIYLEADKKLSPCKSIQYTHKALAWSPEHCRFLPVAEEMVGETEDGVLRANLKGILKPWMRAGQFAPDHMSDGLQGWVFPFWSICYEVTGTFTYHDGRVLQLTNGRGVNEPQVVTPIT